MSDRPRYATLRDYLRVIRSHRAIIAAVAAAFAFAGLALSLAQTPLYTAETTLSFRDLSQDVRILGNDAAPELAPDQRAAISAENLTSAQTARAVAKAVGGRDGPARIDSTVEARVGARTNFVVLAVTDEDPRTAARVANAYADYAKTEANEDLSDRITLAIASLNREVQGPPDTFEEQVAVQTISQLRTVREIIEPVAVEQRADVPTVTSSPRTKRNTVLALIFGLAVGLGAAFVRDAVDRRLHSSDDVHTELGMPILARVPIEAMGMTGFVGGAGDEDVSLLESFRVLRTNLDFLQGGAEHSVVAVTSAQPEEGKSTVAISLASASAIAGRRTLLVECDLHRPCLADRLGIEPSPGLSDYLLGDAAPADVLQAVELAGPADDDGSVSGEDRASKTMVCITAGRSVSNASELLASPRFGEFLRKVAKVYEMVVIDTSPMLAVVDPLQIIPLADTVLLCVRLSQTTREEARAAREALGRLPERPAAAVVTGVRRGEDGYGYYGYYGAGAD